MILVESIMNQKSTSQITLRGLPADFIADIKKEARRLGLSLSDAILKRLLPGKNAKDGRGACADLIKLAGTWDKRRAQHFDESLSEIRKIDAKEW